MVEFQAHAMDGAPYRADRREFDTQRDAANALLTERHGIAAISAAFVRPGVKPLAIDGYSPGPENVRSGAYLLSRPLLLVAPTQPTPEAKRFVEFLLSREGQQIVSRQFVTVQ
jgi:phosphate transport system substrate-binding protein